MSTLPTAPREHGIGLAQFLTVIVVAVAIFLAWDFGRRIFDTLQLMQSSAQTDLQLREEQQINAGLKQLKVDVATDDWVEKWARTKLHFARPNETQFIPSATPQSSAPTPPSAAAPPPAPPRPFWQDWLEILFGPSPS